MDLVIVESPTKAKTLSKFLGKDYEVTASMGHVIDLPKKEFGIDVENNFEPKYVPTPKSKKTLSEIKKKAESASKIFLATDPDREGEAIAWHLKNVVNGKNKKAGVERVVFHEITKEAVEDAFLHPRGIDKNLFDAQQARRVLDRIVGYKLSPLLWKKVRYGLSAGRVQSVAVRLIVDREAERKKFVPQEYWSLDALLGSGKEEFVAGLFQIDGKKPQITSKNEMDRILGDLSSFDELLVKEIERSEKKRHPYPPFTTSTLTQSASNKFGFTAKRTMQSAQKLFEAGFITYHRTDSFNLSSEFLGKAREAIAKTFGKENLPPKPNFYKTRARNAQEAHEAIRPTNPFLRTLEGVSSDEEKIYELIFKRALASQMLPALFDVTSVLLQTPDSKYAFKANGSKIKFEGWLGVYGVSLEDEDPDSKNKEFSNRIPDLKEGDTVLQKELKPEQHFTEPPPRYTEASLIKALEEDGVGRPSTYAPTISTIQDRGYVRKDGKYFVPEDVAVVVNKLLTDYFPKIVDIGFTASLEEQLDDIAEGKIEWVPIVKNFYGPFVKEVEAKDLELSKKDMTLLEETSEKCPECGKTLNVKLGKYGRFLSCSGFPDCKYAKPLEVSKNGENSDFIPDESQLGKCPECEAGVLGVKNGRFGKFVACSNYPKCKFAKPYLEKIGMACPDCKEGEIVVKKGGRFKKLFYGCSRYPQCKFVSSKDPRAKTE